MPEALNKQQLIVMVQEILDAIKQRTFNDRQWEKWVDFFDRSTPCPRGDLQTLIFYPHLHNLGDPPTAQEIVEKALSYKPIQL